MLTALGNVFLAAILIAMGAAVLLSLAKGYDTVISNHHNKDDDESWE